MLKGQFGDPEQVKESISEVQKEEQEAGGVEEAKESTQNPTITAKLSIKEIKPENSKRVRFKWIGEFTINDPIILTFHEVVGSSLKLIYETQAVEKSIHRNRSSLHEFRYIQFNTDILENDFLTTIKLEVKATALKKDRKGVHTKNVFGKRRLKLKSILELKEGKAFSIEVLDGNSKVWGRLNFFTPWIRPIFTFLDYKINLNLNIIPVIVVDFSISNLTFKEDSECIHTLKADQENQYITVLQNIIRAYK